MRKNYFKAFSFNHDFKAGRPALDQEIFVFDEHDPARARVALDQANEYALKIRGRVCVFRKPHLEGPWSGLPVVGEGIGELEKAAN